MLIGMVYEHLTLLIYLSQLTRNIFHQLILFLQNVLQFAVLNHLLCSICKQSLQADVSNCQNTFGIIYPSKVSALYIRYQNVLQEPVPIIKLWDCSCILG